MQVLKNFSLLVLSELWVKVITFVLFIYLGRVLDPEDYGYLSYLMALTSYFLIFIELGLPKLGTREVAAHPQLSRSFLQAITQIKLLLFLGVGSFWLIYVLLVEPPQYKLAGSLMAFYLFTRAIDFQWYLQAEQRFDLIAKLKVFRAAILLLSLLVLLFVPSLLVYVLFFNLSAFIPLYWYMHRFGITEHLLDIRNLFTIKSSRMSLLLKKSLPLATSSFLILMYYNLDTILLRYMIDLQAVAAYNAAYKLVFAFIIARNLLHSVVFPRMAKSKMEWKEDKLFLVLGLLAAFVIVTFAAFFSEEILQLVYAGKYNASAKVFFILSLTAAVLWINLFFPAFFIAIKREYFYLKVQLLTTLLNLTANLLLIPRYGIEGAAWATLIADVVSLLIFGSAYYRIRYSQKG